MLQSRCISGCKSDSELPRELPTAGYGKGDLMISGLQIILLKWTWYLSKADVFAGVPVSVKRRTGGSLSLLKEWWA